MKVCARRPTGLPADAAAGAAAGASGTAGLSEGAASFDETDVCVGAATGADAPGCGAAAVAGCELAGVDGRFDFHTAHTTPSPSSAVISGTRTRAVVFFGLGISRVSGKDSGGKDSRKAPPTIQPTEYLATPAYAST